MIDELNLASFLLDSALDRYLKACSNVRDYYLKCESFSAVPSVLSQRVASEASIVSGLGHKLQAARATINWTRNCSNHLVPVNALPPELLSNIFQYALGPDNIGNMHRHPRLNRANNTRNTISSEVLSHVCTYWRKVALSSPHLWTRIDLSPCRAVSASLLPRSESFAVRAGGMPLDIYITDPIGDWPSSASLDHFVKAVAPHIRSLDLRIYQTIRTDTYRNTLSACLTYCVPGTFTTLTTTREPDSLASTFVFFDMPDSDMPEHGVGFYQQMYTVASEAVLLSIKKMCLHAFYPFWTSKAYYGLVELRLTPRTSAVSISEFHLRGILQASPDLRVLEFALEIVHSVPEGSLAPIRLNYLEVLNLRLMKHIFVPAFLGMIAPGSCPLQLSLSSAPNEDIPRLPLQTSSAIYVFFAHTNVALLHANDFDKDELVGILKLCPGLQTLSWDGYNASSEPESDELISHSKLQNLYMVQCEVELDVFPRWIDLPALENLIFYRCAFYQDGESEDRIDERDVNINLRGVEPAISFIGFNMPSPIEEWELFDSDS
ncbi:F-box-like [Rhizoctonia solani]|uniref:F-box-like n=1 Tax=Rhizoctonia solani TaxID=456999 RepID=A0A8H7IBI3_9AGAM|nr:F-box-like [Rhizoctonia solani]